MEKQHFERREVRRLADAAIDRGHGRRIPEKKLRRINQISDNLRQKMPQYKPEDVEALENTLSRNMLDLQRRSGFYPKRKQNSYTEILPTHQPQTALEKNQDAWEKKGIQFTENFDTLYQ